MGVRWAVASGRVYVGAPIDLGEFPPSGVFQHPPLLPPHYSEGIDPTMRRRALTKAKLAELAARIASLPYGLVPQILRQLPWEHLSALRGDSREFLEAYRDRLASMEAEMLREGREVTVATARAGRARTVKVFRILGHRTGTKGKMNVHLLEDGARRRRCPVRIDRTGRMYARVPSTGPVDLGTDERARCYNERR